ncbi:hypothetical protein [Leifsonia poae]|uniref:hypothetical protein n=1 Tax=Leifsonia poae TaxID=110933 RepID=UPI001CBDDD6A|nr:hypothetical protein [Leifsonia poae]
MASSHEFFSTADPDLVRSVIGQTLTGRGFTVETTPTAGFVAKRGSVPMTVLFGGLAGGKLYMSFTVEIMQLEGQVVARLSRVSVSAFATGGAIGAAKANNVFMDTANALGVALHEAGVLTSSRQVA